MERVISTQGALKRSYAMMGKGHIVRAFNFVLMERILSDLSDPSSGALISTPQGSSHRKEKKTELGMLMQIGAWKNPGVTGRELNGLFKRIVRCKCGLFMLEKRFEGEHHCVTKAFVGKIALEFGNESDSNGEDGYDTDISTTESEA
jgi:hypothetical protein